ncbi:hypothetical protein NIES2107_10290 [Nostoc carneum NIES-2107]|nr:hypothetical protein NIES2107_10290 [Nostoc carneum NIES-2107]
MELSPNIFVESRTARSNQLLAISTEEVEDILNKVKQVFFAVWQNSGWLTSKQVAEFYEVSEDTIDTNFKRHRDEFVSDGVKLIRGKTLHEVRFIMNLTSSIPSVNLFPPRAVMRMGFILRDSEVAKQVRNTTLDLIEKIPSLLPSDKSISKLESLLSFKNLPYGSRENPITEITEDIQNGYGWAGNEDLLEQWVISLASYADLSPWRQIAQRNYEVTSKNKTRRYDFLFRTSLPIFKDIEQATIICELKSNYINHEDISNIYYVKRYINLAYNRFSPTGKGKTLVFLFVSPCGITQEGVKILNEIQKDLSEKNNFDAYVDALRLDDLIWNKIYPAIKASYKDEQGRIGNQFVYVQEKIKQICLEICNPDIWVNKYKDERQKWYEEITNRDRSLLPGHTSLLSESQNTEVNPA